MMMRLVDQLRRHATKWVGVQDGDAIPPSSLLAELCKALLGCESDTMLTSGSAKFFGNCVRQELHKLGPTYLRKCAMLTYGGDASEAAYQHMACQVARIISSEDVDTIDDVGDLFCKLRQKEHLLEDDNNVWVIQQAIFALLGLFTCVFRADLSPSRDQDMLCLENEGSRLVVNKGGRELANRTFYRFFRAFGNLLPPTPEDSPDGELLRFGQDDSLHRSSLSFATLVHVGRITVTWTDNLSLHLHSVTGRCRTLYLFRHLSFCALNSSYSSDRSVFHRILSEYNEKAHGHEVKNHPSMASRLLLEEILRSYKLLFCDEASRKLFNATFAESDRVGQEIDPLLFQICQDKPLSAIDREATWDLPNRSVYYAREHFPFFGERLLALQQDIDLNPRGWRMMMQDERRLLDTISLKAVILFGVLSLLLSLLQLIVGILQLKL